MKLYLIAICFLFGIAVCSSPGSLTWPKSFTLTGVERYDDMGVREPITIYYDGEDGKLRKERYGGNDTTINMGFDGCHMCWANYEPTCYDDNEGTPSSPLEDYPESAYTGQQTVRGIPCHRYATQAGPRQIEMFVDFSMNPVRATYLNATRIMDYYTYKVGKPESSLFVCRSECRYSQLSKNRLEKQKQISRSEMLMRNYRFVQEHNSNPNRNYSVSMNSLSDLTEAELARKRMKKGFFTNRVQSKTMHVYDGSNPLPDYVNWVEKGAVHAVKDQADCGSCWSFATAETIESAYFIKYGKSLTLSEQNLMSCSWDYNNNGCDGGVTQQAYQYVINNGGLYSEDDYHYMMANLKCQDKTIAHPKQAPITSFTNVKHYDEDSLKSALQKGPVAIAINAALKSFHLYTSGIYDDPDCTGSPYELDHAVIVVGYGTENGQDYWLVQNSWGVMWGDKGFIKFSRKGNTCGILTDPTYPIVA